MIKKILICFLLSFVITFVHAADKNDILLIYVGGKVLNVTSKGILLTNVVLGEFKKTNGTYPLTANGELIKGQIPKVTGYDGIVFVEVDSSGFVDGFRYTGATIPNGKIQYNTVSGTIKTVLSFKDIKEVLSQKK